MSKQLIIKLQVLAVTLAVILVELALYLIIPNMITILLIMAVNMLAFMFVLELYGRQ